MLVVAVGSAGDSKHCGAHRQGVSALLPERARAAGGQDHTAGWPAHLSPVSHAKSFTLTQAGWKLRGGNRLRIGSTVYKFAKSRDIEGVIKTVTIKRDALGELYVYFSCLVAPEPVVRVMTGQKAGFDFGLRTYLTGSDGFETQAPQPFRHAVRLRLLMPIATCRSKVKGSNNRRKAHQSTWRVSIAVWPMSGGRFTGDWRVRSVGPVRHYTPGNAQPQGHESPVGAESLGSGVC